MDLFSDPSSVQVVLLLTVAGWVWSASKVYSSIQNLKEFRDKSEERFQDLEDDVGKINIRVTLLEEKLED